MDLNSPEYMRKLLNEAYHPDYDTDINREYSDEFDTRIAEKYFDFIEQCVRSVGGEVRTTTAKLNVGNLTNPESDWVDEALYVIYSKLDQRSNGRETAQKIHQCVKDKINQVGEYKESKIQDHAAWLGGFYSGYYEISESGRELKIKIRVELHAFKDRVYHGLSNLRDYIGANLEDPSDYRVTHDRPGANGYWPGYEPADPNLTR